MALDKKTLVSTFLLSNLGCLLQLHHFSRSPFSYYWLSLNLFVIKLILLFRYSLYCPIRQFLFQTKPFFYQCKRVHKQIFAASVCLGHRRFDPATRVYCSRLLVVHCNLNSAYTEFQLNFIDLMKFASTLEGVLYTEQAK